MTSLRGSVFHSTVYRWTSPRLLQSTLIYVSVILLLPHLSHAHLHCKPVLFLPRRLFIKLNELVGNILVLYLAPFFSNTSLFLLYARLLADEACSFWFRHIKEPLNAWFPLWNSDFILFLFILFFLCRWLNVHTFNFSVVVVWWTVPNWILNGTMRCILFETVF